MENDSSGLQMNNSGGLKTENNSAIAVLWASYGKEWKENNSNGLQTENDSGRQ